MTLENNGPPEIQPEELTFYEKIGGGCYGNVFRGECRGKEVAIKKLFKQDLKPESIAEFKKEVEICSRLHHPNVLLFMGACTKPNELCIVTELMPKGNLETTLRNKDVPISLRKRMLWAKDTALGMNWLHRSSPAIIHRDLKPSNLLIDKHGTVKVCDFGLSAIKKQEKIQDTDAIPGTPLWMAPEVLQGKPLDEKCDVYSFAIVLWEIYTREEPFPEFTSYREFKRAIIENIRPPIPPRCPPSLAQLMRSCWEPKVELRPSFSEIIQTLDSVIVDATIDQDEVGNQFWKRTFLGKESVSWDEFSVQLARYCNLGAPNQADLRWLALHTIITQKEENSHASQPPLVVTLERFGHVLSWFGPLEVRSGAIESSATTFLDRILETLSQPWFHGDIERVPCEAALKDQTPGTYLVRVSTTVAGAFTISKMASSLKINHQRIDFKPSTGYKITVSTQSGQHQVVSDHHVTLKGFIEKIATALHLTRPLTPNPYEAILKPPTADVIGGYLLPEDDQNSSDPDDFNYG